MIKKVMGKMKEVLYDTVVEKDAEELVKRLGDKEAIEGYFEENEIPTRKSAYERLHDTMVEQLDDDRAQILFDKKFQFVARQNIAVLWEAFEIIESTETIEAELDMVTRRLEKIERLEPRLQETKKTLHQRQTALQEKLGHTSTQTETPNTDYQTSSLKEEDDIMKNF